MKSTVYANLLIVGPLDKRPLPIWEIQYPSVVLYNLKFKVECGSWNNPNQNQFMHQIRQILLGHPKSDSDV